MPPTYHMLGSISSNDYPNPVINLQQQNDGQQQQQQQQQFPQFPTVFRGHPQPLFFPSPQYPHFVVGPQFVSAIPSPHYVVPPNSAGAPFSPAFVPAIHHGQPPFMVPLTICNNVPQQQLQQPIVQQLSSDEDKETTVNHATCIDDVPSIVSPIDNQDQRSNGDRTEEETLVKTVEENSVSSPDNAPAPEITDTSSDIGVRAETINHDNNKSQENLTTAARADTQSKSEMTTVSGGDRSLPVAQQNHAVQDSQAIPNNNPEISSSRCQEGKSWASLFQNSKTVGNKRLWR